MSPKPPPPAKPALKPESAQADPLRAHLLSELADRQGANRSYSLRAFARDLRINPATLSQVLSGKRRLSSKNFEQAVKYLELSPGQVRACLIGQRLPAREDDSRRQLSEDEFRLVSDWYCFAILNLAKLKVHRADPLWIAKRLGLTRAEATSGVERLQRLGLLRVEKGKLIRTEAGLSTLRDVPSEAVRKFHRASLQNAEQALSHLPVDVREFSVTTLACKKSDLKAVKDSIHRFKRELADQFDVTSADEVYQLAIQFFPLTKEIPT